MTTLPRDDATQIRDPDAVVELRCTDTDGVAHVIEDALLAVGIVAIVLDDHVGPNLGRKLVQLLIDARDQGRARELVERARREGRELPEWDCLSCGERNPGTFELCWNCQSEPSGSEPAHGAAAGT